MEIRARRHLGAKYAIPPLGKIQIDVEDSLLGETDLEHQCEPGLESLPHVGTPFPEKEVLRRLLRDGGGPPETAAALALLDRFFDLLEVESFVQEETVVFRREHCAVHEGRDAVVGGDDSTWIDRPCPVHEAIRGSLEHDRRGQRLHEVQREDEQEGCCNEAHRRVQEDASEAAEEVLLLQLQGDLTLHSAEEMLVLARLPFHQHLNSKLN